MNSGNKILLLKTTLVILVLIALALYNNYYNGDRYREQMRENAEWNIGGLYVKSVNDNTFYAESHTDSIVGINYRRALPEGEEVRVGDLLKIKSIHLGGDTVDVIFINVSRTRGAKIWLSVIPVLVFVFLFFKYFKFDKNIMRFKIK